MSQQKIIPIVLLCALPASGKSESRAFLRSLPSEESRGHFKIGFPTTQLDDYPYVEVMRIFDNELQRLGQPRSFFFGEYYTFIEPFAWGVLIKVLNEDYLDVKARRTVDTKEPTKWIIERFNRIYEEMGLKAPFKKYSAEILDKLAEKFNPHMVDLLKLKNEYASTYTEEKTIIVEFARGGGCGSDRYPDFFPLPHPYGYNYSLPLFLPEILSQAAMLYIYVTPDQSFAKNLTRAPPVGWTGSTDIFHCVPELVMRADYGSDDFFWMLKQAGDKSCLKVKSVVDGKEHIIPVGVFDNREDLTTFCRGEVETWPKEAVTKIHTTMKKAFEGLLMQYKAVHPGF